MRNLDSLVQEMEYKAQSLLTNNKEDLLLSLENAEKEKEAIRSILSGEEGRDENRKLCCGYLQAKFGGDCMCKWETKNSAGYYVSFVYLII